LTASREAARLKVEAKGFCRKGAAVPLSRILEETGLKEGVKEIFIESVDGFYESVPLDEARDALRPRPELSDMGSVAVFLEVDAGKPHLPGARL
jgi:hypothetical protein